MRVVETTVLWLSGLSLLAFGVAFEVAPLQTMAAAGLSLQGALAATELRAFYGGIEVATGILVLLCAWVPARRRDGLILSFAIFAGIGGSRLFGMLSSGADTPFLRFALATELGLAVLSAVCLVQRQR
jgi:Domain of unknown function (DUF4345)